MCYITIKNSFASRYLFFTRFYFRLLLITISLSSDNDTYVITIKEIQHNKVINICVFENKIYCEFVCGALYFYTFYNLSLKPSLLVRFIKSIDDARIPITQIFSPRSWRSCARQRQTQVRQWYSCARRKQTVFFFFLTGVIPNDAHRNNCDEELRKYKPRPRVAIVYKWLSL